MNQKSSHLRCYSHPTETRPNGQNPFAFSAASLLTPKTATTSRKEKIIAKEDFVPDKIPWREISRFRLFFPLCFLFAMKSTKWILTEKEVEVSCLSFTKSLTPVHYFQDFLHDLKVEHLKCQYNRGNKDPVIDSDTLIEYDTFSVSCLFMFK